MARKERKEWFSFEEEVLRMLYPRVPNAKLAWLFGCAVTQVYSKAYALGLKKSPEFMASSVSGRIQEGSAVGASGRFRPGMRPWNKGLKGVHTGGVATQFKPGCRGGRAAEQYKPIGTERIGPGGYLERKINDDLPLQARWRAVHLLIWEEANGPVPPGHALLFKDGDRTHVELRNLELISRADLMRRNSIHNLPREVKEVIHLRAQLVKKLNRRDRSTGNE